MESVNYVEKSLGGTAYGLRDKLEAFIDALKHSSQVCSDFKNIFVHKFGICNVCFLIFRGSKMKK